MVNSYVGEKGQPFHLRVNGNQFDIAHRRTHESPVSEPFNSRPYALADMSVMVIKHACSQDLNLRRRTDSRWIRTLGMPFTHGMNHKDDSLCNLPPPPPQYLRHFMFPSSIVVVSKPSRED